MPLTDNEKLRAFEAKVIGDANEHAARIATDAYERKEAALAARRIEVQTRVRAKYDNMYERTKQEMDAESSKNVLARNKKYLALRDEITDKVLARTAEMIESFVKSPDYENYLSALTKKVSDMMSEPFTLALREADISFADKLKELAGSKCTAVAVDSSIRYGGAQFRANSGSLIINETLEENLAHARDELMLLMGNYLRVDD